MSYDTLNPVPSTDPRDLDDNAQFFDRALNSTDSTVLDRLGVARKTYHQMELDAQALVSPNVAALAALTAAANKGIFFSAAIPATMGTYTLSTFTRTLAAQIDGPGYRTAIGALGSGDNIATATKLQVARQIAITGDATWSASFDGSANVTGALTLSDTGVGAGTFTRVTVDSKGRVTSGQTSALAVANGGTGATTAAAARTNLAAAASGVNTDITSLSRGAPAVKTADFTVAAADSWLLTNGAGTIVVTLPAAASFVGREIMIKTISAQAVNSASANIAPLVGGTVGTSILTAAAGKWATLVSNGTNWVIMQAN